MTTSHDPEPADLPAAPAELVPLAAALADVCASGYAGSPSRALFDATLSGPHRLLFIAADGSAHSWNNAVPAQWRPTSLAEVELVACVGPLERVSVENCDYLGTGGSIDRYQRSVDVNVVTARSGAATVHTLRGAQPERCPSTVGSNSSWDDITGDAPEPATVKSEILDRYVLAPDCGESRALASCLQCWRDELEATPSGCGFVGGGRYSEALPNARTGQPVALDWRWELYPDALFLPAAGFDWSLSTDAALLATLTGEHTSFVPVTAGAYSFQAQARLPAAPSGRVVQTRAYSVEVLDRPVIEDLLGGEPALTRVGQSGRFRFTIRGRPPTGRFGEALRWTWLERPSGSSAAEPSLELGSSLWAFVPDLPGSYRVQLEYSDGIGFSEPATTAPISAISGPLVTGLVDRETSVGVPTRLEGSVTHAVGFPAFRWTLSDVPDGSSLTTNYFSSTDRNSLIFTADVAGSYRFEVLVTDSAGQSEPIAFSVTAS